MQRVLSTLPISSDLESNPIFNVLIAYQDFDTGREAKKVYDFVASNVGEDCRCDHQMWKFDVFGIPKLRELASRDATAADIIVISCRTGQLPSEVRDWVESWLLQQPSALALVAMYDESEGDPVPEETMAGQAYLAEAAKRGGMEFFLHTYSNSDNNPGAPLSMSEMPYALRSITPSVSGRAHDPNLLRWGINE
jgi:hypothetical protein